jgi:hypothetical protein
MAGGCRDASGAVGWVAAAQSLGRASPKRHRGVTALGVSPELTGSSGSPLHVVVQDSTRHVGISMRAFTLQAGLRRGGPPPRGCATPTRGSGSRRTQAPRTQTVPSVISGRDRLLGFARTFCAPSLRAPQVLFVAGNRRRAPDQGGGMFTPIGQGHAQQSLVHVLGRAVSQRSRRRDTSGASHGLRRHVTRWLHRHGRVDRPVLHGRPVLVPGALSQ